MTTPTPKPNIVERIINELANEFPLEFSNKEGELEKQIRLSLIRAIDESFEVCDVEDANHEKNGKNISHSKDQYYGCCECYEDKYFNSANTLHHQNQSAYLKSLEG